MRIVCAPDTLKGVLSAPLGTAAAALARRRVPPTRRRARGRGSSPARRRRRGEPGRRSPPRSAASGARSRSRTRWGGPSRRASCSSRMAAPSSSPRRRSASAASAATSWTLCGRRPRASASPARRGGRGGARDRRHARRQRHRRRRRGPAPGPRRPQPRPRRAAGRLRRHEPAPRPARRGPRFGPQKGATAAQVEELERRLAGMEELRPFAELPRGRRRRAGLGAALAALGAELVPGIELVLEAVRFRERIEGAALVVTGEGSVDKTSAAGKVAEVSPPPVPPRVCRRGCVVFGGRVRGGREALYSSARRPCSHSAAGASGRHVTSPSWASRSGGSSRARSVATLIAGRSIKKRVCVKVTGFVGARCPGGSSSPPDPIVRQLCPPETKAAPSLRGSAPASTVSPLTQIAWA